MHEFVSGCSCIRLQLYPAVSREALQLYPHCILYPVAVVSGQMLQIVSQLYLKKPNFLQLYPVAIVSGCIP